MLWNQSNGQTNLIVLVFNEMSFDINFYQTPSSSVWTMFESFFEKIIHVRLFLSHVNKRRKK